MDEIRDLLDQRQIDLFDALHKLSNLAYAREFQVPQLIVVGDQSSGKSSLLEALVRFHFPVHENLCTRFPTKLILRRSTERRVHAWVEEAGRRKNLPSSGLEDAELDTLIDEATAALGVLRPRAESSQQQNGNSYPKYVKNFSDGVLVIEKHGPDLPLISLVDLPGLFQSESLEQDKIDKLIVKRTVREFLQLKGNVVLLVINAAITFVNQTSMAAIEEVKREDPELADRTVGVITRPDHAHSRDETIRLLKGNLDKSLKRWHVVLNQDRDARRSGESFESRDQNETKYLSSNEWREVPSSQKGIAALRTTLRSILWTHTSRRLPSIIHHIEDKITAINAQIQAAGPLRNTDRDRRLYLDQISETFAKLMRKGVEGRYYSKRGEYSHRSSDANRLCMDFFHPFGDNRPDSQDKRLRANIRSLNMKFAMTMRDFGKTDIVVDTKLCDPSVCPGHSSPQSNRSRRSSDFSEDRGTEFGSPGRPHTSTLQTDTNGVFLPQDIVDNYYTYDKPRQLNREQYQEMVTEEIERWRAGEPRGEASEEVYGGLFEHQSQQWARIATQHLQAIWQVTKRFVRQALAAACADERVARSLWQYQVCPRLRGLEEAVNSTLFDLLSCHEKDNTGFYDGFPNVLVPRAQVNDRAEQLAQVAYGQMDLENPNQVFKEVLEAWSISLTTPIGGLSVNSLIKDVVINNVSSILKKAIQSEGVEPQISLTSHSYPEEFKHLTAARVIEQVETYYEMSMVSFVGYVNSLVVEHGILRRLPDEVLSQSIIWRLDDKDIEKIAAEPEGALERRRQLEQELKTLQEVSDILNGYLNFP